MRIVCNARYSFCVTCECFLTCNLSGNVSCSVCSVCKVSLLVECVCMLWRIAVGLCRIAVMDSVLRVVLRIFGSTVCFGF